MGERRRGRRQRLAIIGIAFVIVIVGGCDKRAPQRDAQPACPEGPPVRGAIGSEKLAFFNNETVQQLFSKKCLRVEVEWFGSWQMARLKLSESGKYDFVFPAGELAAKKIQTDANLAGETAYAPFSTLMAIATFKGVPELLQSQRLAWRDSNGVWWFDVKKYLEKYFDKPSDPWRWQDIPNNTIYNHERSVLVTTADPRQSNSAAMYVAIVSYVLNKHRIVDGKVAQQRVMPRLADLFLKQGHLQGGAEGPFDDYRTWGVSRGPMVLVYEAQFLSHVMRDTGELKPEMMLMYLTPTVDSKHTLIPLSEDGHAVGRLLTQDPTLKELEARFGFRTTDSATFHRLLNGKVPVPSAFNFAPLPSYGSLDEMLKEIGDRYDQQAAKD